MPSIKTIWDVCPSCDKIMFVKTEVLDNSFESLCPLCGHVWQGRIMDISSEVIDGK